MVDGGGPDSAMERTPSHQRAGLDTDLNRVAGPWFICPAASTLRVLPRRRWCDDAGLEVWVIVIRQLCSLILSVAQIPETDNGPV